MYTCMKCGCTLMTFLLLMLPSCYATKIVHQSFPEIRQSKAVVRGRYVRIENKNDYFKVVIDYAVNPAVLPENIGREYAQCILEIYPQYEVLADSYLMEIAAGNRTIYTAILHNARLISDNIPKKYMRELKGMGYVFQADDLMNDGKLSFNELLALNLLPDAARATACSAISFFGKATRGGSVITGRNLEWYPGGSEQLLKISSVTIIKNHEHSICSVGYLGMLSVMTGVNDASLLAGILDAPVGSSRLDTYGKNSYVMDVRYLLEHYHQKETAALLLTDNTTSYAYNHLVFLSDRKGAVVIENCISGKFRALRYHDSKFHQGVTWGIPDVIVAVNSFMLRGNIDNHSSASYNYRRWKSYQKLAHQALTRGVNIQMVKKIMTYEEGTFFDENIFKSGAHGEEFVTLHSVVYDTATRVLQVYFRGKDNLTHYHTLNLKDEL